MGNVIPENAERIRQYVLDCNIRRLTAEETAEYHVGLPINVRTVKRYRTKIRDSAQHWIARLAKSKRADYIAEYRERIDEVRKCQRELWNIIYDGHFKR
jgi:RNA binding exosome subunit